MLKALRYEILRGITASGRIRIPLAEKPVRVATILNEALFNVDKLLIHHGSVFLEDRIHDWDWADGVFRYYTRVAEVADVLVVYEIDSNYTPAPVFDGMTGRRLAASTPT
ncbi:hypothetical protein [Hydrogenophaga sp. 2FB]|uniref:hypothetical protein n=1 Tax=Hydrogenophaga sp. 2FB TaxID=2502187 RepID=UPI0010F87D6C|nr:hypothetical protein [Hydrogenophaga sp. 2FB]